MGLSLPFCHPVGRFAVERQGWTKDKGPPVRWVHDITKLGPKPFWSFLILLLKGYLFMCVWVFYLHMWLCMMRCREGPKMATGKHWIPWDWSYWWLWVTILMLEIKLGSSVTAASAGNWWAISPAPRLSKFFLNRKHYFYCKENVLQCIGKAVYSNLKQAT